MSEPLRVCEICKQTFPLFYHPGAVLSTETGRIHRGCIAANMKICAFCDGFAAQTEIMKELPLENADSESEYLCPDCWHGHEHGPRT